jgi:hypothetical protein
MVAPTAGDAELDEEAMDEDELEGTSRLSDEFEEPPTAG